MFDKMSVRRQALNVQSGDKKYIDGTFGTRDLDKSRPDMNCGTHVIAVGTGKYAGPISL